MYSTGQILKILFRGGDVKKSEIILKSENLHPCTIQVNRPSSRTRLRHLCTGVMVNSKTCRVLPPTILALRQFAALHYDDQ